MLHVIIQEKTCLLPEAQKCLQALEKKTSIFLSNGKNEKSRTFLNHCQSAHPIHLQTYHKHLEVWARDSFFTAISREGQEIRGSNIDNF